MPRPILVCVTLLASLGGASSLPAVDYFWSNSLGGAFDEPSHWLPFAPPGTQGPGGANDTVNFDLGVAASNRYLVTDAGRENNQLIVHNDSVELTIFINHALLSGGGANPSLIVGAASGDTGDLILSSGGASVLETRVTSIGDAAGSTGFLTIDNLEWVGTGNVRVGHAGTGTLTIDNDSVASGNNAFIGNLASSVGEFNVLDDATWTSSGDVTVGRFGAGEMTIDFRGSVTSTNGTLGEDASASGVVFVDNGASWTMTDTLTVGESGFGLIANIFSDVVCHDAFVGRLAGSDGQSHVSNNGATWTVTGRLSIAGDAFTGVAGGTGLVAINPGALVTVDEGIVIFPDGELRLGGGTLFTPEVNFDGAGGLFQWNSGTLQVDEFNGNLSNQGGVLATRPNSNAITVSGEYAQGPDGVLSIEIAGEASSNQYDSLIVTNTAFLGGELEVHLADLFGPSPDDVYVVLDALNFGAGSFSNVPSGQRLADASGIGSFAVHYGFGSPFDPSQVVLTDFLPAHLPGDYNDNGTVDAADYVVWRNNEGTTNTLPNDPIGGAIGPAHYDQWRAHFGQTAGSGSTAPGSAGGFSAVPEPPAHLLVSVMAALVVICRTVANRAKALRLQKPTMSLARPLTLISMIGVASPALAVTTNWIANSGNFTTAANWDNGVPDSDDTAVFNRGFVAYEVNFPGGSIFDPPPNYAMEYLRVNTNEVSFVYTAFPLQNPPSISVLNPGVSIVVGENAGDVAILNMTLNSLSGANASIGRAPGAQGTLNVGGTFSLSGSLNVGESGQGTMNVTNGGTVSNTDGFIGVNSGTGQVTVSGAGARWANSNSVVIGSGGRLTVNDGGVVSVMGGLQVNFFGRLVGNGRIEGNVASLGLITPGTSPAGSEGTLHIDGNFVQSGGPLHIELAAANSFDKLEVDGNITLGGTLNVSLLGGYSPADGATFDILDWTGTQNGTFSSISLAPPPAGLKWDTSQLHTSGVLSIAPGYFQPGEFIAHSQDSWGGMPSAGNAAQLLVDRFDFLYQGGAIEVGINGLSGFSMVFTSASTILDYLPATGGPGSLNSDHIDPTSTSSGIFGGLVLALQLNVDFIDAGELSGSAAIPYNDLMLFDIDSHDLDLTALNGLTVRQFLDIANAFLGSGDSPYSPDDIANFTDLLTGAFEGGTPSQFAQDHLRFPGDFNGDRSVDAADYVVWRDKDGMPAGYNTWRANFGRAFGSGSGATGSASAFVAVPEPPSLILTALAIGLVLVARNRASVNRAPLSATSPSRFAFVLVALAILTCARETSAQVLYDWINPSGGSYHSAANWFPGTGAPPDANDGAGFGLDATYIVSFFSDAVVSDVDVINGDVTFDLGAGSFSSDYTVSALKVTGFGSTPRLTVDGGLIFADTMLISNGGQVNDASFGLIVARDVTVTGAGSTWTSSLDMSVDPFSDVPGSLTIQSGGSVSNVRGSLGGALGESHATVTGAGSLWTNSSSLVVGYSNAATGILTIEAGGAVSNTDGTIGEAGAALGFPASVGHVSVTGAGSTWTNTGILTVGQEGVGTLIIENGGDVSSTDGSIGVDFLSSGHVTVTGAGSTWTNGSSLSIGVTFDTLLTNAMLEVSDGGVVSVGDALQVLRTGRLSGDGLIEGNVFNDGKVAPGTSPGTLHIDGNFQQTLVGELFIELAAADSFDKLDIDGNVTLEGKLHVSLLGGYAPVAGTAFDILDWTGLQSGTFADIQLPPLQSGLSWDTSQLNTIGAILVVGPQLPGDYNQNGIVDAADYIVWRNNLGSPTSLPNDDTPGVGPDDYNRWRAHFGQTAGSGSGVPRAITNLLDSELVAMPEPSSGCLLCLTTISLYGFLRPRMVIPA